MFHVERASVRLETIHLQRLAFGSFNVWSERGKLLVKFSVTKTFRQLS
jgi:hypothetical protein